MEAKISWKAANQRCKSVFPFGNQRLVTRPHLASIGNKEEEIFVNSLLGGTKNIWVGGKRLQDGTWIWTDGTEFSYTNWELGEPNNDPNPSHPGLGKEDSILINWISTGKWNDIPSNHGRSETLPYSNKVKGFICQYKAI